MRVSSSISILLSLAVVALTWWLGNRQRDFMQAPSAEELALIQMRAEQAFPTPGQPKDAVSAPIQRDQGPAASGQNARQIPVINEAELRRSPSLSEYRNHQKLGPVYLIDLAKLLESRKQWQRALIAWERVIDGTKPNPQQARQAIKAVQRLRAQVPDWNHDPTQSIPIMLHAGTGARTALQLQSILEESARNLEIASSGILKVDTHIAAGIDDLNATGAPPVALWLSGPTDDSRSTDILSFSVNANEDMRQQVDHTLYRILRAYIAREVSLTPPLALQANASAQEALNCRISRHTWKELGNMLNLPP